MYYTQKHEVFSPHVLTEADAISSVLSFDNGSVLVDDKPIDRQETLKPFHTATVVTSFQGVVTVREYSRQISGIYLLKVTSLKDVDEEDYTKTEVPKVSKVFKVGMMISCVSVAMFVIYALIMQSAHQWDSVLNAMFLIIIGYYIRKIITS